MNIPRIIISGLSGGTGKTLVSLGITRALTLQGYSIKTFKKGPDYIDAAWLSLAANTPQGNLDPYFSSPHHIQQLFVSGCQNNDIALVEGNRGLFDGMNSQGTCSTAELSRILCTPIVLVVDCTKMTRTAAALVAGCKNFEKGITIGGVILNRTGTSRQRSLIRTVIEEQVNVPVLGALPRSEHLQFDEQRLGLAGTIGNSHALAQLDTLAAFMQQHIDMDKVVHLAKTALPLTGTATALDCSCSENILSTEHINSPQTIQAIGTDAPIPSAAHQSKLPTLAHSSASPARPMQHCDRSITIGYVCDACFSCYYQENLDALKQCGAILQPVSLLEATLWPYIDALYIGGGSPEEYAETLAQNTTTLQHVSALAAKNIPIYAEGAGMACLCQSIITHTGTYPMSGILQGSLHLQPKPQGLGYTQLRVTHPNPYHPLHTTIKAHEFTFWQYIPPCPPAAMAFTLQKGKGLIQIDKQYHDGIIVGNIFASSNQIYAPAAPHWAAAFVAAAKASSRTAQS